MVTLQRDKRWYRAIRFLAVSLLCRIFGFRTPEYDVPDAPYLAVSNHTTNFDPIFLGRAFRQHMYFVASEHVFRRGFASKLLNFAFHPIARVKGTADATAALAILRKLRASANVCLFAEGNRSYNGVTGPVFPATGKLVKSARAALVTYRIRGGYLASPRWSACRRHGPITGELVNIYTADMLRAMSAEEINAAIARDLFEDAYARQALEQQPYPGKRLAEYLECALYVCPVCGRIGTLHSRDDRFFCDCGLSLRYTPLGYFAGDNAPFTTVRDWDAWQEAHMTTLAQSLPEAPVFSDAAVRLLQILDGHDVKEVACGTLAISSQALTLDQQSFPFDRITDMALCGTARIAFTTDDGTPYELAAELPFCGRKYVTFYQKVKEAKAFAAK